MSSRGNSSDMLTRIGEQFGASVVDLVRPVRELTVTVVSIDGDNAMVRVFDGDTPLPVPLAFLKIQGVVLRVVPTVDSLAVVCFMNGNENTPFFSAFSQVDEVLVTVGESTVRIVDGLIEMNGGTLKGLVAIGALTERLNKLQSDIDNIQSNIASHSHTYIDSVGQAATPVTKTTVSTTYTKKTLTQFKDEDYINEKITQ